MQLSRERWQRPLISHACIRSRVSPSCPDPTQLLLRPDLTLFFFPKIKSVLSAELPGLVADVFHPPNFRAMLKAQTLRRNTCSEGAISSPTALLSYSAPLGFLFFWKRNKPLLSSSSLFSVLTGDHWNWPCHVQGAELPPFAPAQVAAVPNAGLKPKSPSRSNNLSQSPVTSILCNNQYNLLFFSLSNKAVQNISLLSFPIPKVSVLLPLQSSLTN